MPSVNDFVTNLAGELGLEPNNVTFEFKDDKLIIEVSGLDEDAFDEEDDITLDDAEDVGDATTTE